MMARIRVCILGRGTENRTPPRPTVPAGPGPRPAPAHDFFPSGGRARLRAVGPGAEAAQQLDVLLPRRLPQQYTKNFKVGIGAENGGEGGAGIAEPEPAKSESEPEIRQNLSRRNRVWKCRSRGSEPGSVHKRRGRVLSRDRSRVGAGSKADGTRTRPAESLLLAPPGPPPLPHECTARAALFSLYRPPSLSLLCGSACAGSSPSVPPVAARPTVSVSA
jgi:hypothetical protein